MAVYIESAEHISIQQPLSDAWFDEPVLYDSVYVRAVEPNYKEYLEPNQARRMGKILKRAIITSRTAVKNSSVVMPDTIISGTGLGCIENTEIFLDAMVRNGEELLQPTHFMQSTHNTISSLIGIDMKCHGYNNTYVHKGVSFESALLDAYLQFSEGRIQSALVGGYDEMTPSYFLLLSRIGYWRANNEETVLKRGEEAFAGETSVSFMMNTKKTAQSICKIGGINLLYKPSDETLQNALNELLQQNNCTINDIDAVVVGTSGNKNNDTVYEKTASDIFPNKPLIGYKHIFGESYTASGLGIYAAVICLKKQCIPKHLLLNSEKEIINPKRILFYNQFENKNHSLILLENI